MALTFVGPCSRFESELKGDRFQWKKAEFLKWIRDVKKARQVTSMVICRSILCGESIVALQEYLERADSLQTLVLDTVALQMPFRQEKLLPQIVSPLIGKDQFRSLELTKCQLNDRDMKGLVRLVQQMPSLECLMLKGNRITNVGAQNLAQALLQTGLRLRTVDLSDNLIGDQGAVALLRAQEMGGLSELHILGPQLSPALQGEITLRKHLVQVQNDEQVDLQGMQLGDAGVLQLLPLLSVNRRLSTLRLVNTGITEPGARSLRSFVVGCSTLTTLSLHQNELGDNGCAVIATALQENCSLTHLSLSKTQCSPEGALMLSRALATNANLLSLNLGYNDIGCEGMSHLAEALKFNRTLRQLHLRFARIGDEGADLLAQALETNRCLRFVDLRNNFISDDGASELAGALTYNPHLQSLLLSDNPFSQSSVEMLTNALEWNDTLTELMLPSHNLSLAQMQMCSFLPMMRRLQAGDHTLTELSLRGGRVSPSPLRFPDCAYRRLAYLNTKAVSACIRQLAENLYYNRFLISLDLSHLALGDSEAEVLAGALASNQALLHLNLSHNALADKGVSSVAQAVAANTTLLSLNLEHNPWMTGQAACWLGAMLAHNQVLQALQLKENKLGNTAVLELMKPLSTNSTLTDLDLSGNSLTNDMVGPATVALSTNYGLRCLRMGQNPSLSEIRPLAAQLRYHPFLTELDLPVALPPDLRPALEQRMSGNRHNDKMRSLSLVGHLLANCCSTFQKRFD